MVLTLIRFVFVINRILWRACRSLRFPCGDRSWAVDSEVVRTKGSAATAEGASGLSGPLSRECCLPVRVAERSVATAGVPAAVVNNPRRTGRSDNVPATPAGIEVRLPNSVCMFVPCTEPDALDGVISAVGRLPAVPCAVANQGDVLWEGVSC
jgi:hypothetical protein